MSTLVSLFIGILIIFAIIAIVWRQSSRRSSIPCPSWLGWMVELDNPFFRNNRAREIIRHLELEPEMQVLDFGCGPGRLTIPVAKQITPGGSVTAFDIQEGMLQRVREKAQVENVDNIQFIHGAAGEGKLGHGVYDRVLLVTVLGEIPDQKTALAEVFEGLRSGGILSVTEVIADPHFQRHDNVRSVAESVGFKEKIIFGHRFSYTINFEKP